MGGTYRNEELRPLVHFTPREGFMNDPNGLCRYGDTWFLFFQHNPSDIHPGNTHWGMAVSGDLLHWEQRDPAICPDDEDGNIFSGSGVVDYRNVSGLREGEKAPILLFYTGTGMRKPPEMKIGKDGKPQEPEGWTRPKTRQCVAYSVDGGKHFRKYPGNPILGEYVSMNRDPKVNFVPEENAYVMALFLTGHEYMLFWSEDLLHWQEGQRLTLPHTAECPDLFSLGVDGEPEKKWVFYGSPENYMVGRFENRRFVPETPLIRGYMAEGFYGNRHFTDFPAYAAQTFFAPRESRVIQMSWIPTRFPAMGFQGQMSLPWELTLRRTAQGLRLAKNPAGETESLRKNRKQCSSPDKDALNAAFVRIPAPWNRERLPEALELCIDAVLGPGGRFSFAIRGIPVIYEHVPRRLSFPTGEYTLPVSGDRLDLRIIADRGSVELFSCGGLFNCVLNSILDPTRTDVEFYAADGCEITASLYELSL